MGTSEPRPETSATDTSHKVIWEIRRGLFEPPYTEPFVRWCGRSEGATPPPTRSLIHTFSFEILLRHIVVILPEFDIKISAIDVKFWMSPKTCHTHIISSSKFDFSIVESPNLTSVSSLLFVIVDLEGESGQMRFAGCAKICSVVTVNTEQ
jgi:hypothetical protein